MSEISIGARPRPFFGWTVMWAAFVIAIFGWGVGFYGPPIFLKAVHDARGWSVGLISAAVTVHFLIGALTVANLPRFYRRFGLPAVTISGAASLGLGVIGWSLVQSPWQLFVATLFSGAGWVALGAAAINAMIAPWFQAKRPAALSTAFNGASIGGVVFSPLWVALIGALGFAAAAGIVASVMILAIAIIAFAIIGRTPERMGLLPDGAAVAPVVKPGSAGAAKPVANLWTDRAFQTLALGMALALFAQIGLIAHLFSLLVPALGAQGAGLAAGGATAAAILGRTLVGWFLPAKADRRIVAALNCAVQMIGCAAFIAAGGSSVPLLVAGVLLFGVGIGNATSMPPLIVQVEFAKEDGPRAVAAVTATAQASYAFAPAIFGLIWEATALAGSAATPWLFAAAFVVQILAACAYLAGRGQFLRR